MLALSRGHKLLVGLLCLALAFASFQWWWASRAEQLRMMSLEHFYWSNVRSATAEDRDPGVRYGASKAAEAVARHPWGVRERGFQLAVLLSGITAAAAFEAERVSETDILWALSVYHSVADRTLQELAARGAPGQRRLPRLTAAESQERFDEICIGLMEGYGEERFAELFSRGSLELLQRACDG